MRQNQYSSFLIARSDEELEFPNYISEGFKNTIETLTFKGENIADFTFEVGREDIVESDVVKFTVKATRKERDQ